MKKKIIIKKAVKDVKKTDNYSVSFQYGKNILKGEGKTIMEALEMISATKPKMIASIGILRAFYKGKETKIFLGGLKMRKIFSDVNFGSVKLARTLFARNVTRFLNG